MKRIILSTGMVLFLCIGLCAQQADSISTTVLVDSLEQSGPRVRPGYPNPKKALLFAIIPGGGQIYNKRWWKLPFVYGALGGMIYLVDYNQGIYKRFKVALDLKRDGQDHEFSNTGLDNLQSLRSLRDRYDKNRQLAYVGVFLVYTLQGMEAFVDAHLKSFDIDDNLSLKIKPVMELNHLTGQAAPGMGISIQFGHAPTLPVQRF